MRIIFFFLRRLTDFEFLINIGRLFQISHALNLTEYIYIRGFMKMGSKKSLPGLFVNVHLGL